MVCSKHHFVRGDIVNFYFEGRTAGGKGGRDCGPSRGNAYDGAGLGQAVLKGHENEFKIIAGGGGGSAETNFSKGGNAEENGAWKNGGKGATKDFAGAKGDSDAKDGYNFHGGEGSNSTYFFPYCGGGVGNGYYGGGGGGGSGVSNSNAGGGGGGSNLCVSKDECKIY